MSYNFFDLLGMTKGNDIKEDLEELEAFFKLSNYDSYLIPDEANEIEISAVKVMFDERTDLIDRICDARDIDPLCIEAFYAELTSRTEVDAYSLFMNYYSMRNEYDEFTPYGKSNYLIILDFFVEYLIDIHNITKAIEIQKVLSDLSTNNQNRNTTRLAFLYYLIERHEEFYKFYEESEFKDPASYLLLINTLLKNDKFNEAKIVLNDMIAYVPYSEYIYRIWELEDVDSDAMDFKEAVNNCFDELCSVPNFFVWCKENIEEVKKS